MKHEIGGEGKRREGNEVLFLCVAKKRRCEEGKKEGREYKGLVVRRASISAIAVVLLFRRNGGYCCEAQKKRIQV